VVPRTDAASRVILSSIEQVYSALLDPEALIAWLPPGEMTGTIERFDPRPGGSYRMVLRYPVDSASQGKTTSDTDVVEARFIDIVPGAKIVWAVDFVADDPAYATTMVMTWEVTAVEEGTRVDITANNVPDAIPVEDHAEGMDSSLAKLAEYLER
jgi:uncharacterized protein YndB with AHSA1/START domain